MSRVTKIEAAKRWKISPAAVTKMVRKGLPVRPDGALDWETVDRWRRENVVPMKSGSFAARRRAAAGKGRPAQAKPAGGRAVASGIDSRADDFGRGYAAARSDLRECLPVLLAIDPDRESLAVRIREFLRTDALLGRWPELLGIGCGEPVAPIDWGDCAPHVQKLAAKIQSEVDAEFAALRAKSLHATTAA